MRLYYISSDGYLEEAGYASNNWTSGSPVCGDNRVTPANFSRITAVRVPSTGHISVFYQNAENDVVEYRQANASSKWTQAATLAKGFQGAGLAAVVTNNTARLYYAAQNTTIVEYIFGGDSWNAGMWFIFVCFSFWGGGCGGQSKGKYIVGYQLAWCMHMPLNEASACTPVVVMLSPTYAWSTASYPPTPHTHIFNSNYFSPRITNANPPRHSMERHTSRQHSTLSNRLVRPHRRREDPVILAHQQQINPLVWLLGPDARLQVSARHRRAS